MIHKDHGEKPFASYRCGEECKTDKEEFRYKNLIHNSNAPNEEGLLAGNFSNYGNEIIVEAKNKADYDTKENNNNSDGNIKDKDLNPTCFSCKVHRLNVISVIIKHQQERV